MMQISKPNLPPAMSQAGRCHRRQDPRCKLRNPPVHKSSRVSTGQTHRAALYAASLLRTRLLLGTIHKVECWLASYSRHRGMSQQEMPAKPHVLPHTLAVIDRHLRTALDGENAESTLARMDRTLREILRLYADDCWLLHRVRPSIRAVVWGSISIALSTVQGKGSISRVLQPSQAKCSPQPSKSLLLACSPSLLPSLRAGVNLPMAPPMFQHPSPT